MFRLIKHINLRNNYRLYHKRIMDHYENPRNVGSFNISKKNIHIMI